MDSVLLRKTVIDIGTNTMLMLVAETTEDGIKPLTDVQRIPRLGKGIGSSNVISKDSIQKAAEILNEYKLISNSYGSQYIKAVATSFLRDASNKNEFINEIYKRTGIGVELLNGDDESRWTYIGGVYDKIQSSGKITLIDIGGGSTEITTAYITGIKLSELTTIKPCGISLNIGSVRLKEKYFNQGNMKNSVQESIEMIRAMLNNVKFDLSGSMLVGVAGTITTLAAIKSGLEKFNPHIIDGTEISYNEITALIDMLSDIEYIKSINHRDYMQGRSDIILPGSLILGEFMNFFGFDRIRVSTKGLRYGIMLREMLTHSSV
jgi:exopolyphosphatase/guanosine-5'-triphosphate,3'-diphosphate pyrophosphatase